MKPTAPRILTINGGSSSIKFALFEAGDSLERMLEGGIERIGLSEATLRVEGVDPVVFAGGIGENAPTVRARICDGLEFLGIELEEKQNAANESVISRVVGRAAVRVIRTDEERMIAATVGRVLGLD